MPAGAWHRPPGRAAGAAAEREGGQAGRLQSVQALVCVLSALPHSALLYCIAVGQPPDTPHPCSQLTCTAAFSAATCCRNWCVTSSSRSSTHTSMAQEACMCMGAGRGHCKAGRLNQQAGWWTKTGRPARSPVCLHPHTPTHRRPLVYLDGGQLGPHLALPLLHRLHDVLWRKVEGGAVAREGCSGGHTGVVGECGEGVGDKPSGSRP